ncbi:TPA: transcriptional regulator [Streptococcus suis]|nr:transcriptional regulator [Streptococcus suis]
MSNVFLQDKDLSLEAKGLLATILTNQTDWRIYLDELITRSKTGRQTHRKAYKELVDKNYLKVLKTSNGRGRGVQTYIFAQDMPISDFQFDVMKERLNRHLSTGIDNPVDN